MQSVLVTGAAGFIGTKLVSELIRQNYKVYTMIEKDDINSWERLKAIDNGLEIIDDSQYMFKYADSYPAFSQIFHLATVGVSPEFKDINLICDVNIKLGCQLIDFAKENKSGVFINFGSCFEYGDHGNVLLTEDMECRPETLYAISKNVSTNLITGYAKLQNVKMITVRPFGVFGEGEGVTRLAPTIIKGCMNGESVKTTFGEQIRDFVNVKDLVRAVIKLSESQYKAYEVYNICSDYPVSVKNFILEIIDVCGFDISLVDFGSVPYRENEAMIFAGNNKKLQSIINYPFPNNHKEGILDIYNSLKRDEYNVI